MTTPIPPTPPKLAYRIDEAVKATGLGRSFLYERMAEGSLKSVKIGGRRLILGEDLVRFLSEASQARSDTKDCGSGRSAEVSSKTRRPTNIDALAQLELPWRQKG